MNLILSSDDIRLIGVSEDLETISFRDDVGFSTADLISGFNASDAGTPYVDGLSNPYPAPEDVVFYLRAYHVPYTDDEDTTADGDQLTVARTSNIILDPVNEADIADVNFDYGAVMNNWTVSSPKDGRIKVEMFAIDVDAPSEDFYYNSATGEIIRTSDSAVITSDQLGDALTSVVETNLLKTSKLDANIADIINRYTKLTIRGKCKDEEEWRKHILYLQSGRTAAKVQFDTYGNFFNAAFIIESLEQYIKVNDLEIAD